MSTAARIDLGQVADRILSFWEGGVPSALGLPLAPAQARAHLAESLGAAILRYATEGKRLPLACPLLTGRGVLTEDGFLSELAKAQTS